MKRKPLTSTSASKQKRADLLIIGQKICSYRQQVFALQKESCEAKDDETKALLQKKLEKASVTRIIKMKKIAAVVIFRTAAKPRLEIEVHILETPKTRIMRQKC